MSSIGQISLHIDAYGLEARESALADLVEWQALQDQPMTQAELADYVRDCDWARYSADPFSRTGEGGSTQADPLDDDETAGSDWAQRAFDLISERIQVLGDRYPFSLKNGRLGFVGPGDWRSPYLALLAITTSHALALGVEVDPKQLFEEVVAATIKSRGFLATELGRVRREKGDFGEALEQCCTEVHLRATPEAASFKKAAHDEGVDVVGHLWWGDHRPGRWVFLGQVTCGKSNTWRSKSTEPGVGQWRGLLGMHVNPHVFLAVPHHVPERTAEYLAQKHEDGMLLDRLRICVCKVSLLPEEEKLLDAVALIAKAKVA